MMITGKEILNVNFFSIRKNLNSSLFDHFYVSVSFTTKYLSIFLVVTFSELDSVFLQISLYFQTILLIETS